MRIGLIGAVVPFEDDPATALGEMLEAALRAAGHQAELVLLPFARAPGTQLTQLIAFRSMEFAPHYDTVVTLGAPAELVRHPRKIAWIGAMPKQEAATLFEEALDALRARASIAGLREARCVLAIDEAAARRWENEGILARLVPPDDPAAAVQEILA